MRELGCGVADAHPGRRFGSPCCRRLPSRSAASTPRSNAQRRWRTRLPLSASGRSSAIDIGTIPWVKAANYAARACSRSAFQCLARSSRSRVLRLLRDSIEDVGEPSLGGDVAELRGADEGIHHRRPLAATIRALEQPKTCVRVQYCDAHARQRTLSHHPPFHLHLGIARRCFGPAEIATATPPKPMVTS